MSDTKNSDPILEFSQERFNRVREFSQDLEFKELSRQWMYQSMKKKYVYNFDWLGRPIIQYPQDMVAIQEIIWRVRPDLIIETGIAHGGSLVLSASMLALLDLSDACAENRVLDPLSSRRKVLGVDIDIREHNRSAIEGHFLSNQIQMIQGSSISEAVIEQVASIAANYSKIMVFLDSNHTHDHVLAELSAYARLVSTESYCVVFDSFVEDMPEDLFPDRPWTPTNNPRGAIRDYLRNHPEFEIDRQLEHKLLITVCPDGFLKKVT